MPLNVKAFLSENEIFDSGVIVIRDLQNSLILEISPPILGAHSYRVQLKFFNIEGHESVARWSFSEGSYNLEIINFDSPAGLTLHGPLTVGSYEQRAILLDFVVYTIGTDPKNAPKLFCYTLRAGDLING
jgi:hypothetical protein